MDWMRLPFRPYPVLRTGRPPLAGGRDPARHGDELFLHRLEELFVRLRLSSDIALILQHQLRVMSPISEPALRRPSPGRRLSIHGNVAKQEPVLVEVLR